MSLWQSSARVASWLLCAALAGSLAAAPGEPRGATESGNTGDTRSERLPSPESLLPAPPARVRVLAGQATVLLEGDFAAGRPSSLAPRLLTVHSAAARAAGYGYLELGPGSLVEIRRTGEVSLRVTGPAELEWSPPPGAGLGAVWRVSRAAGIDLEVRRAVERVGLLYAGWELTVTGGALHVAEQRSGGALLKLHGGPSVGLGPAPGFEAPLNGPPVLGRNPGAEHLLVPLARRRSP